jgi:hypothetical protein
MQVSQTQFCESDFRGHFAMIFLTVSSHQTELNSPGNEYIGESFQDGSVDLDRTHMCCADMYRSPQSLDSCSSDPQRNHKLSGHHMVNMPRLFNSIWAAPVACVSVLGG